MSSSRKVKGAIFSFKYLGKACYFLGFQCGETRHKEEAHVYTCAQIKEIMSGGTSWGGKADGKWLLVYE